MFNPKMNSIAKTLSAKVDGVLTQLKEFKAYDLAGLAINGLTPKKGYQLKSNVAYGLKSRQRMDLYLTDARPAKALILFVHGGAWSHGDKNAYTFVGEAFARYGYDVAILNYHLAPEHIFPSYIDDLAVALQHLEQHQQKYGLSTENIVLMGHSAGAFNITSLIYHPQNYPLKLRENIKAIVGIAGPYHFDYKGDALAQHAFNEEIPYQDVMPYYFVEKNAIQHYLLIAENDQIVHDQNTLDLQKQLLAVGNHCEVMQIPRTGHISIIGSVSSLFSPFFKTRKSIVKALDQALNQNLNQTLNQTSHRSL